MLIQAAGSQALALSILRLSGSCATGGANHIRSSLMMVLEDTATGGTAGVGSSGPPEDREAGCRVYPGLSGAQP